MPLIRSNSSNTIKIDNTASIGNKVFTIKTSNFVPNQDNTFKEITTEINFKKELKIGDHISSYSLKTKKRIEGPIVNIEKDKYNNIIEISINHKGKTINVDPTSIEIIEPKPEFKIQESTFMNYYDFINKINK